MEVSFYVKKRKSMETHALFFYSQSYYLRALQDPHGFLTLGAFGALSFLQ